MFLSAADYDCLASQRNCDVLLWYLKENYSVTCESKEYAAGFLAAYDGCAHSSSC